jgi:hypothetical protein
MKERENDLNIIIITIKFINNHFIVYFAHLYSFDFSHLPIDLGLGLGLGLGAGVVVWVPELPVEPDDPVVPDAAFAIAAPPPTRAPVTASVVSVDLRCMSGSPPLCSRGWRPNV